MIEMLILTRLSQRLRYNKMSPSSPEQKSNQKRFKKAIRNFMNRNKKYLVGKSVPERMSLDVMIEILDLLKSPGGMRANVAAPIGKSNDPYYQTHYRKECVWRYMVVVSVQKNQNSDELTSVILAQVDMSARAM